MVDLMLARVVATMVKEGFLKVQCDNSRILRGLHGYCYFQLNYASIFMPCVVEHHNSCLCPSVVEDRYWFLVLVYILQLLL